MRYLFLLLPLLSCLSFSKKIQIHSNIEKIYVRFDNDNILYELDKTKFDLEVNNKITFYQFFFEFEEGSRKKVKKILCPILEYEKQDIINLTQNLKHRELFLNENGLNFNENQNVNTFYNFKCIKDLTLEEIEYFEIKNITYKRKNSFTKPITDFDSFWFKALYGLTFSAATVFLTLPLWIWFVI